MLSTLADIVPLVHEIGKKLMSSLTRRAGRKDFFSLLSGLLREHVPFDRLCINLYEQQSGILTYFTAAEGAIVSTLSPVRPAETNSTVAGHVIATRKPVIITDFAQYFSDSTVHPIAEAGLTATMAFPLIIDNEIIATLHCSFAKEPDNIYEVTSFLHELSPVVATCLGAILQLEQLRQIEAHLAAQPLFLPSSEDAIICHSAPMREVMRKIDAVAKLDLPVLLLGETGTGKSLIAQDIHRRSLRKNAHFIKVNCPALPQTLFESELFGHARGAFTGAAGKRAGRFELAHGGTLFLDEIAELSPEMQSKLLQVLEDATFERVGESIPLAVNVRIIAATNVHLGSAMARGTLRPDLFYRLSPCTIELPPLREHREDIPPLVASISAQISMQLGLPPVTFTPALIAPLRVYDWPGNIRELRNVVSRLLVHNKTHKQLTPQIVEAILAECRAMVTPAMSGRAAPYQAAPGDSAASVAFSTGALSAGAAHLRAGASQPEAAGGGQTRFSGNDAPLSLAEMERRHIIETLKHTRGTLAGPSGAAALLGLPRTTLQHRMRKLGIQ